MLAYDEESGEKAYKPVVQLFRNTTKEWYHVHVNGEEIICTGGHPFYVLNAAADRQKVNYESQPQSAIGAWICARHLRITDKVLLSDGSCAIIEAIEVEKLAVPQTTYNFEVADFHTYYVTQTDVLVHNACRPTSPKKLTKSEIKRFNAEQYKENYVGKKGSRFDIFKDTANHDQVWLGDKAQKVWIETGEKLIDLFEGVW